MTQKEIQQKLHSLRYQGKWSINKIAAQVGLSPATISKAHDGSMSKETQLRLSAALPKIAFAAPVTPRKGKPGHRKRYLIRYLNLKRWIGEIERDSGLKLYRTHNAYVSHAAAGYVCAKLDYILKRYLLEVFGKELEKAKIALGDCYSAEKWIEQIAARLPNTRRELCRKLKERRLPKN